MGVYECSSKGTGLDFTYIFKVNMCFRNNLIDILNSVFTCVCACMLMHLAMQMCAFKSEHVCVYIQYLCTRAYTLACICTAKTTQRFGVRVFFLRGAHVVSGRPLSTPIHAHRFMVTTVAIWNLQNVPQLF